jgi:protein-tyrosine phosphatase
MRNMQRAFGGDPAGKLSMLLDYTDRPGQVADPWYTGNFDATWQDVSEGCRGLLEKLRREGKV